MNVHRKMAGQTEPQAEAARRKIQQGKLVSGGRLQIPADVRRQLGLSDGDAVTMEVVDGRLHVRPYRAVLAEVQGRMRALLPPGKSGWDVVDELIAERRAAAERE